MRGPLEFVRRYSKSRGAKAARVIMPTELEEELILDNEMVKLRTFSQIRKRHYELVDGVNILLLDALVRRHAEFPQQIASMKRSGAFIIMHASENYEKFGRRLEDINEDLLVLTSYIVRHICAV